ncbi:hypothetical protein STEG23_016225 [Scotinomys teguina]
MPQGAVALLACRCRPCGPGARLLGRHCPRRGVCTERVKVWGETRNADESESRLQFGNAGMELDYLLVKPPVQITPSFAKHSFEREGRECAEAAQD